MPSLPSEIPKLLRFEGLPVARLWGGRKLLDWLSIPMEGEKKPRIGEVWEIFDRGPESSSLVAGGPLRGYSLSRLLEGDAPALLGRASLDPFGRFPLMLKFIEAEKRLSLQVHPDADLARSLGLRDAGKEEAWVVLGAEPGSEIVLGLRKDVTGEAFFKCLRQGKFEPLLEVLEPELGDSFYLPPGTMHCIGTGLRLYEIQQNSDLTFRLTDWGRVDQDGKPRPLHWKEGRKALELELPARREAPRKEGEGIELLVSCPSFELRRLEISGSREFSTDGWCQILTLLEGQARIESGDEIQELGEGGSCLVTGRAEGVTIRSPAGGVRALLARPNR